MPISKYRNSEWFRQQNILVIYKTWKTKQKENKIHERLYWFWGLLSVNLYLDTGFLAGDFELKHIKRFIIL